MEKMEHKTKVFKDYYQNADYKKKHLEYIMTKVACPECGAMCARCNLTKHKRSIKHKKYEEGVRKKNEEDAAEINKLHEAFLTFIKTYKK